MAVGAELEKFAVESAMADDVAVADVYTKAGAKVSDLDDATLKKWQALARPVWKDYSDKNENCAKLLAAGREAVVSAAAGSPETPQRSAPEGRAASAVTHGVDLPGAPEGKLAVHAGALGVARSRAQSRQWRGHRSRAWWPSWSPRGSSPTA